MIIHDLTIGDRVSTNAAFAKKFPRCKAKTGQIVASVIGYSARYAVIWDGRKRPETIHASFLSGRCAQ